MVLSMRSNLRNITLLNGFLVDTDLNNTEEYLEENGNELNNINNELNNALNNELNSMNNELNSINNELNNELILFFLNRQNRIYYLFHNFEKNILKNTLTTQQIEKLERCNTMSNCPICMEETDKNIKLNCNHIFCITCIEKWFLNKSNTCPICRVKIE